MVCLELHRHIPKRCILSNRCSKPKDNCAQLKSVKLITATIAESSVIMEEFVCNSLDVSLLAEHNETIVKFCLVLYSMIHYYVYIFVTLQFCEIQYCDTQKSVIQRRPEAGILKNCGHTT